MGYPAGETATAVEHFNRHMAHVDPTSNVTFTAHQVLADDTVTFVAIATHIYKITYSTRHSNNVGTFSSPAAVACNVRWIAGAGPITTSSTLIRGFAFGSANGNSDFTGVKCVTGISGTITIGVSASASTGTQTFNGGTGERMLLVEDLGR